MYCLNSGKFNLVLAQNSTLPQTDTQKTSPGPHNVKLYVPSMPDPPSQIILNSLKIYEHY